MRFRHYNLDWIMLSARVQAHEEDTVKAEDKEEDRGSGRIVRDVTWAAKVRCSALSLMEYNLLARLYAGLRPTRPAKNVW